MKKFILSLIGIAALSISANAQTGQAGQYRYVALTGWDGSTTNSCIGQKAESLIGAGAATNAIVCTKNDQISILVVYKALNAESNTVTLHWQDTPDPAYWPVQLGTTNSALAGVWTVGTGHLTNSAGYSVWATNLPMGTMGYFRMSAISNNMAAASYITNVMIRAYFKPIRAN